LAVTTKELEADEATQRDLHQNCMEKSQEFEAET
jgi:hypothetical protein